MSKTGPQNTYITGACEAKIKTDKRYKLLKEYDNYYLYAKHDKDGNFLYRECFNRFDIDGAKEVRRKERDPLGKYK